jgi:hypothetical protein
LLKSILQRGLSGIQVVLRVECSDVIENAKGHEVTLLCLMQNLLQAHCPSWSRWYGRKAPRSPTSSARLWGTLEISTFLFSYQAIGDLDHSFRPAADNSLEGNRNLND